MSGVADAFEIFEFEPRFDLDLADLAARHKEMSLALHPDRFAGRSAAERRTALSKAIEVNEAKRRLSDPVQRAEVLLARLAAPTGEGREPPAAPELLMEMMERREALREAALRRDKGAVERLCQLVKADEERTLFQMKELFRIAFSTATQATGARSGAEVAEGAAEAATQSPDVAADRKKLLSSLGALRYYRRFFDEAGAALDELD